MNTSALVLLAHKAYGLLPRVSLNGRSKVGHAGHLGRVLGIDGAVLPGEHPGDEQFTGGVVPQPHDGKGGHATDSSETDQQWLDVSTLLPRAVEEVRRSGGRITGMGLTQALMAHGAASDVAATTIAHAVNRGHLSLDGADLALVQP